MNSDSQGSPKFTRAAYYNFAKKHSGINGMTPAEASLIEVDGKNKWFTLIQNASLHRNSV